MDYLLIDINNFNLLLERAKRDALENISVTKQQALSRRFLVRKSLLTKVSVATRIQKLFRGHRARVATNILLEKRREENRNKIYDYFACLIQKVMRGFHVRRTVVDYYERKRYLENSVIVAAEVREKMEQYHQLCLSRDLNEKEIKKEKDLQLAAEKLHYMLSTSQQRGILDPNPELLETPTIENVPVERILRNVVRDLLRTKGVAKTGLVTDLHGSRTIPMKLSKSRISLQASSSYDIEHQERNRTADINKIIMLQQGKTTAFKAGIKTKIIDNEELPLCIGELYMDPYLNVNKIRGVPNSQDELNLSLKDRKPYFIKKLQRPYYIRAEGNKSTVLANDIFDVMYEAEQFGGSAQRHLGTQHSLTKSFGVPSTADNNRTEHDEFRHEFASKTLPNSLTASLTSLSSTTSSRHGKLTSLMKPKRTKSIVNEVDSDDEKLYSPRNQSR